MSYRRNILLCVAVLAAIPALAQTVAPGGPSDGKTETSSVPDFSGTWLHPAFPWFEPPAAGPGPITNLSRWPQMPGDVATGTLALPPVATGISDYDQLVGDYKNPILQPWVAEIVKQFGERSRAGITTPNPSNQCWPFPTPFIYKEFQVAVLQGKDTVTLVYGSVNFEVRRIRMNVPHSNPLKPSWYGDSVGHYEGDTLVVDTIGIRTDRPYAVQDLFGTPYTDKLHMVERYQLRDYDDVKDAIDRNKNENWLFMGDVWSKHRGKFMQVQVTVEDEGVFTSPFSATVTYVPSQVPLQESICAENLHEYYNNKDVDVPKADRPDF